MHREEDIFLIFWGISFNNLSVCSQSQRCVNKKVIFHKNIKLLFYFHFKIFICAPAVGVWEKILLHLKEICLLYGNRITKYWPIKQAKT